MGLHLLCTTGGEISITLTLVFRRFSRRQSVKTFRAVLEAQYDDSVAAGTMAMFEPVLVLMSMISTSNIE